MEIYATHLLDAFKRKHADARRPLDIWQAWVERSAWQGPEDIRQTYRSADFLSGNRVIFNIKGNHYRLVIQVRYRAGAVVVDWVGTHAEYSRKRF